MRLFTIALFATSYLGATSAAANPPQIVVVPHGLSAALRASVSQSAAASNSAANSASHAASSAADANANGAAHAAANYAAAAAASSAATNASSSASNASANGAAHAAANSAAAASANAAASAANSVSAAGANGAAHVASNSAAAGSASAAAAIPAGAGGPVIIAQGGGPPAIIQIGGPASSPVDPSGSPAIIVLNGGPAGLADGGDAPPKIEVAAHRARASDEQQKLASALNSGLLEFSRSGDVVRKGEVLSLSPSKASLAKAHSLGYAVIERLPLRALGMTAVILRAPPSLTADQALGQLQAADASGGYSLNPVYATTGRIEAAVSAAPAPAPPAAARRETSIGLIDTGVFAQHPALAGARVEQQGFAPGGLTPAKHGTAVASITAGQAGPFRGVAPGSRIYVADVYGKTGAGGAASSVAEGIDWLVRKGAPVINISLVGPSNRLMEAAVEAAIKKGVIVVAAVGNDGPNSPPLYPAAFRGVLAVTAVDQNDHILFEAVRATRVAFAAPGADIFAADGVAGFAKVRGTSFAAPIVAGQLALAHRRPDSKDAEAAIQRLKQAAKAPAATDAAFGFGIVGDDARLSLRPGLSQITTAEVDSAERNKE